MTFRFYDPLQKGVLKDRPPSWKKGSSSQEIFDTLQQEEDQPNLAMEFITQD